MDGITLDRYKNAMPGGGPGKWQLWAYARTDSWNININIKPIMQKVINGGMGDCFILTNGFTPESFGPQNATSGRLHLTDISIPDISGNAYAGNYRLMNAHSGKAARSRSGDNVDQGTYSGATNQRWSVQSTGANQCRIVNNAFSGKALEVAGFSTADGGNIRLWYDDGASNKRWRIQQVGDRFRIVNWRSGKAMEVSGWSTADGANIQQWTYADRANKQWRLQAP